MSGATLAADLLAYSIQIAAIVGACAALPRLLRLHSPGLQYLFWRVLLAVCVTLPLLEPWQQIESFALVPSVAHVADASGGSAVATPVTLALTARTGSLLTWLFALLVVGAGARLLWLLLGLARLRSLRASSAGGDVDTTFDDLQATIGTRASIRWCGAIDQPMTFGLRRPIVLLPRSVAALDGSAARALVAHELFHVKRRDWGWLLVEEGIRAMFWFHPAMWWLVSRVQLARETVVDDLSILATNARRAYMDTLLAFADDSPLSPVTAFSRRRHLFHRIMLLSREGSMSTVRLAAASLVLGAALLTSGVTAVRAFPLQQPPRDPVAGQLSPDQRAILEKAVAQARDALAREPNAPDLHHQLAAALWARVMKDPGVDEGESRRLLREAIAEEDLALGVRPDYIDALTYKATLLLRLANQTVDPAERATLIQEANRLNDRLITIRRTLPPPPPPPPPSREFHSADGQQPVRVGGNIKAPMKLRDVRPLYPPDAREAAVQGVVIMEILIDTEGKVADARILRSVPMLDQAALDAVKQWEYTPTLLNGTPVPVVMTVTVNFTLR